MIKLQIDNWFQKPEDYEEVIGTLPNGENIYMNHNFEGADMIKAYDQEKWRDGKEYEFNTLKELKEFTDTCEIDFKEEVEERFCNWDWMEIDKNLLIDVSEDNKMRFIISCHEEWID